MAHLRASNETDQDVMDSANNTIRVSAQELRAKVFAEGGNLFDSETELSLLCQVGLLTLISLFQLVSIAQS